MLFCRSFVVSQYQKATLGNTFEHCFRKIPLEKKLWINGRGVVEGGSITLFCQKCFSLSAEKMRSGTV